MPNTHFDHVLDLYRFDRELRLLVFGAIEQIEVALRAAFNNHLCVGYGATWYTEVQHFKNPQIFNRTLSELKKDVSRSKERFIKHYKRKYTAPELPPSWMAIEVASFGWLSNCYKNLKPTRTVKGLAGDFLLKKPAVLASWIHLITIVRNICAHHGRLWNRIFTQTPATPRHSLAPWPPSPIYQRQTRLYAALVCILYLHRAIEPRSEIQIQIIDLLNKYPEINIARMGFPPRWEQDQFWRLSEQGSQEPLNTAASSTTF